MDANLIVLVAVGAVVLTCGAAFICVEIRAAKRRAKITKEQLEARNAYGFPRDKEGE